MSLDPGPLLGITHGTDRERAVQLGVSIRTIIRWRSGARVRTHQADRLAIAVHAHPYELWPELAPWAGRCPVCSTVFERVRRQRFCSPRCRSTAWARRSRSTPEGAAANRAARNRYYRANADYERSRERASYRARHPLPTDLPTERTG